MNDGVDCINIFSKGKTQLGRWMSNFYHQEVQTLDGTFQSIEGYWYWLSKRDEKLAELYGFEAKRYGRTLKTVVILPETEFKHRIEFAIRAKINGAPYYRRMLEASTLPFAHFYEYNGRQIDAGFEWLVELWERLRKEVRGNSAQKSSIGGV